MPAPLNMRCAPTIPLEFASPAGKRFDFEFSNNRGVSAPFAQTTTAFARWKISFLSPSKYFTPVTRPLSFVSIFRTYEFGRTSHLPLATATGMTLTSELDLAPTSQPKPRQKPHCTHCARPLYGFDAMAIGAANGFQPSFFAPCSRRTPVDFGGCGGIGYGRDRGGSYGPGAPA